MPAKADRAAAAFLKSGGNKVKAGGNKLYSLAKDPEVQAKGTKLLESGKRMYRAATSPEAKEAYRQVAEIIKKARKK